MTMFLLSPAYAADIIVTNSSELEDAFDSARAGDVVRLMPGTYSLDGSVWTSNAGTKDAPIVVTGGTLPDVRLDFESVEALVFNHPHWVLENVWVNGACSDPDDCQAGVGIKPPADGFVMRGCRLSNWTQHVKASRTPDAEVDDATLVGNEFYNDVPINGSVIDIVGGKRWQVIGNFVHDFGGDLSSGDYGIFLKGGTSDGVIARNLVICGHLRPSYGIEVGISLGGGGTGFNFCPNNDCSCEDFDSVVRNNVVLNCADVGMHTNRACGGGFYHNLVARTGGGLQIQNNGAGSPVEIRNNVIDGSIFGGDNYVASSNRTGPLSDIYRDVDNVDLRAGSDVSDVRDRAEFVDAVEVDYCGTERPDQQRDLGPIAFPATCETFPWKSGTLPPVDDGEDPDADAGVLPDAGASLDAGAAPDAGGIPQDGSDPGLPSIDLTHDILGFRGPLRGGCVSTSSPAGSMPDWALVCVTVLGLYRTRRRWRSSSTNT